MTRDQLQDIFDRNHPFPTFLDEIIKMRYYIKWLESIILKSVNPEEIGKPPPINFYETSCLGETKK